MFHVEDTTTKTAITNRYPLLDSQKNLHYTEIMMSYKKERIDNTLLFFAKNHYQKTKKYLSQTFLYKYIAFFEFRYLKKAGDMPLELTYRAMPRGPVPIEIYDNRNNPVFFSKVIFEPFQTKSGTGYLIKPNGKFTPDYFAEAEIEEMNNLIEIFTQQWVGAAEMSDASHQAIKAWKKNARQKSQCHNRSHR